MVASTDIKFYAHTNNNAPQLQNAYGSMIQVLDACLINGIQVGTISSLTASGSTITATFSAVHNLLQYQVIKITGATQDEFNGEHRVLTVPKSTTITFDLAAAPSVATAAGNINCSLPPLDWEKPFSSTSATGGKGAYRSKNTLLASRPFLRVVDELDPVYPVEYAKFAKVGIVEDMLDINTLLGSQAPFDQNNPNKNWVGTGSGSSAINGWARWYYASATESTNVSYNIDYQPPTNGNNTWILVGTDECFYIIPEIRVGYSNGLIYGFGGFESLIPSDVANTFLAFTLNANANGNAFKRLFTGLASTNLNTCLIARNYINDTAYATAFTKSFVDGVTTGQNTWMINNARSGTTAFDVFLLESGNVMRGRLPLLKWLYAYMPYQNLQAVVFHDEIFIAKNIAGADSGGQQAQILIKVGDL